MRTILSAAGFTAIGTDAAQEPMYFGATADQAFRFVRGLDFTDFLLRDLDADRRSEALAALWATIDAHATPDGVLYPSAAWIIRARRG